MLNTCIVTRHVTAAAIKSIRPRYFPSFLPFFFKAGIQYIW